MRNLYLLPIVLLSIIKASASANDVQIGDLVLYNGENGKKIATVVSVNPQSIEVVKGRHLTRLKALAAKFILKRGDVLVQQGVLRLA